MKCIDERMRVVGGLLGHGMALGGWLLAIGDLAVSDWPLAIGQSLTAPISANCQLQIANCQPPNAKKEPPPHAGIPFEEEYSTGVRVLSTVNFVGI